MSKKYPGPTDYVRDVTENTLGYVRELQDELSCLRAALGAAESEHRRVVVENEGLRRSVKEHRDQRAELEGLLEAVKRERTEMTARYQSVASETSSLATLYVTSYRLQDTLDRVELMTVLQEAIISLLGSEAYVIFDVGLDGSLEELASMGLDAAQIASVRGRPPLVERCLGSGAIYVQGDGAADGRGEGELAAVVPLCREGVAEGVVVIFDLLPHKPSFSSADRELLNLLSAHVAPALYCADLHARTAASR